MFVISQAGLVEAHDRPRELATAQEPAPATGAGDLYGPPAPLACVPRAIGTRGRN